MRQQSGNGHSRLKLHADIAHPINADCRHSLEREVIDAFLHELERSKEPGYVPPNLESDYMDEYDDSHVMRSAPDGHGALIATRCIRSLAAGLSA